MIDSEEHGRDILVDARSFGELLQWFRRRDGLTQQRLADQLEVRRSTISDWENGQFAPKYRDHVAKLAEIFSLSPVETNQFLQVALFYVNPPEPTFEPQNPYKGLSAFTQADRHAFFGRENLVKELLEVLRQVTVDQTKDRLLAAIGPSGSGKTSTILAGLLPELQRGALPGSKDWVYIEPFRPGRDPLTSMAEVFSPVVNRESDDIRQGLSASPQGLCLLVASLPQQEKRPVVLILDQCEELFSPDVEEGIRQQFIRLLVAACREPERSLLVLLVLRSDFYGSLVAYPELAHLVNTSQQLILPLDQEVETLRWIIEAPADLPNVKLTFESRLVDEILFDLNKQIGVLPLLQFMLYQLFQHRDHHMLTMQAYHDMGGVKGALAQYIEQVYVNLPNQKYQELTRALFMRLLLIERPSTESLLITRRQATLEEFVLPDPSETQALREVITIFVGKRLLVTKRSGDTSVLEVSHEALLQEWPRLGSWLRDAGDDMQLQQALGRVVTEWEQRKQPKDRLYRGAQLKEAQAWAKRNRPSKQELVFLRASATRRIRSFASLVVVALLLLSLTGIAGWYLFLQPKPTLVTTYQDSGVGSLRWCIANASSGSTISFAQNMTGTIKLTGGDLVLPGDKTLTISGPGANQLAVSGTNRGAIIHVSKGATIAISGLSFKDSITNTNASLLNEGTLTLTKSIISNNKTNALSTGAFGSGIENKGSLTVIDSIISNNTSIGPFFSYGGGIYNAGQLTVNHSNISNNVIESDLGGGGGIWNYSTGTVTVTNHSIISNNVIRSGDATGAHGSEGGGMFNAGKLTVTNSTFSNNQVISSSGVSLGGGIINVDTGTITVSSSIFSENTATSTTNNSLGGGIDNVGKLTVTNSTFSNNQATSSSGGSAGGGIFNFNKGTVMVNSSTFSENTTKSVTKNSQGGGIENEGKLTVTNSTFSNNQATSSTGNAFSGGINNFTSGALMVTGSTFSKNIAKSDQHISQGGGITNAGKLTVTNSTFSNNQAITSSGGSAGGGIFSISRDLKDSFAIIRFCTIYENSSNIGGGIAIDPTGKSHMTISSNIIVHNSANEGPDIFGTVISEGYNLIENVTGAKELNAKTDRQVNLADLKIEPTLGNHGGPTQTLALLQGSQAIGVVPLQACSISITDVSGLSVTITTDQRGEHRPGGSKKMCDAGAYESSY